MAAVRKAGGIIGLSGFIPLVYDADEQRRCASLGVLPSSDTHGRTV